jgi:Transposase DDE domain/Transposase domain (DUF772)
METTNNHLLKLLERVSEIYAPTTTPKLGRPFVFSELVMLKVFLLMTLKKIKQFTALYRYLDAHPEARADCGLERMPDESTIRKRLKKLAPALKRQIRAWGEEVIKQTITCPEVVAVDKKMIQAQGPLWHQRDRAKGQIPEGLRGVDRDSSWSVSAYRGWVQGYGLHVAVNATAGGAIIPIWAEVATNSKADAKVAAELKENLPSHTRRVLGDEAYDDPKLRAGIERYENHLLTRCLLVPIEVKKRTPGKRQREADRYQREREIYRRRSVSIEPFFDRLDQVFDIEPAWMKGLANNRSLGLLWVAGYLLLMLHQVARGMSPEHVKELIDIL